MTFSECDLGLKLCLTDYFKNHREGGCCRLASPHGERSVETSEHWDCVAQEQVVDIVSCVARNLDQKLAVSGRGIFGWKCLKIGSYAEPERCWGLMVIIKGECSQGCFGILKSDVWTSNSI